MMLRLRIFGSLEKYFGSACLEIELPDGAKLRDLLDYVDAHWGDKLPPQFWDAEAKRFRGPVLIMTQDADVYDDALPLSDQQEILLLMILGGG